MSIVATTVTKTPLILKVVSLYVILASQLWLGGYVMRQLNTVPVAQSFPVSQPIAVKTTDQPLISGQPAQLSIDRIGVKLAVLEGAYDTERDDWTLSDDAAHFATMTTVPNDKQGNTFIYGHNTAAVLEPVKDITVGDILTLTTTNGHVFTYAYVDDVSVEPNQTDVLRPDSVEPKLTLMTCQGIFSETRRIMHFSFVGVS